MGPTSSPQQVTLAEASSVQQRLPHRACSWDLCQGHQPQHGRCSFSPLSWGGQHSAQPAAWEPEGPPARLLTKSSFEPGGLRSVGEYPGYDRCHPLHFPLIKVLISGSQGPRRLWGWQRGPPPLPGSASESKSRRGLHEDTSFTERSL